MSAILPHRVVNSNHFKDAALAALLGLLIVAAFQAPYFFAHIRYWLIQIPKQAAGRGG